MKTSAAAPCGAWATATMASASGNFRYAGWARLAKLIVASIFDFRPSALARS
jgi:hypothetical protein